MNKVINISLLLVLFLGAFSSCKKTEEIIPNEINNTIIFSATGSCLGFTIDYKAGKDNYYMYSDYRQYNASPYNFESILKQSNCATPCPFSVGITLTAATYGTLNFDVNQSISDSNQHNFYTDSTSDTINFNTNEINVFFTDVNGTKYESKNVYAQNGYFNITSIEDFDNNELGQRTKKINYSLSCLVSSQYTTQSSDSLVISGTFAFSYPSP
jgi:hypothetical protein